MVEAFDTNYIVGVREEPRLTEQQFGNFQNLATIVNSKAERARFGRFYYRCVTNQSNQSNHLDRGSEMKYTGTNSRF